MNKQKGFTLIELLVVIVIIGILATLATVALGSARMKARDARRVSDVKQIMTALELYYNDKQSYPNYAATAANGSFTFGSVLNDGGTTTYMAKVPQDPGVNDCTADSAGAYTTYMYTTMSSASVGYSILYCLGGQTGEVSAGVHCASLKGIASGTTTANHADVNCTTF